MQAYSETESSYNCSLSLITASSKSHSVNAQPCVTQTNRCITINILYKENIWTQILSNKQRQRQSLPRPHIIPHSLFMISICGAWKQKIKEPMNPGQTRTANQSAALQRKIRLFSVKRCIKRSRGNFSFDNLKGRFKWKTETPPPKKTCPGHTFHRTLNS